MLETVLRVAMEATGATRGRLLAVDRTTDRLVVVAQRGGPDGAGWPSELVGYVVATGQPQVMSSQGAGALCAPCLADDEVVGALELGGDAPDPFSIDDLELTSLLAGIAGAAIASGQVPAPPSPSQLTGELGRLAAADPARYATVARLVQSLLHG